MSFIFLLLLLPVLVNEQRMILADDNDVATRIVHGFDCHAQSYPYLISLQTVTEQHVCGASLLQETWVLTAAHCCSDFIYYASAGLSRLRLSEQRSTIRKKYIHPYYSLMPLRNDVCLLKLNTPIYKAINIIFLKIANKSITTLDMIEDCKEALVLGFGYQGQRTVEDIPLNSHLWHNPNLQCMYLQMLPMKVCMNIFPFLDESSFCGKNLVNLTTDACKGDSGGPFVCKGLQYGVVSSGIGCGVPHLPGIYARLDILSDFIFQTIRNGCWKFKLRVQANISVCILMCCIFLLHIFQF